MPIAGLGFLLGVWILQQQADLPSLQWVPPLLVLAFSHGLVLYSLRGRNHLRRLRSILILSAALSAGFAWALLRAHQHPLDELPDHRTNMVLDGVVVSLPMVTEQATRFLFDVERDGVRKRLRVSWYDSAPLVVPGETWRLTLRLRAPRGFMNPGGFDYEGWLRQHKVWAVASVRPEGENRRLAAAGGMQGRVDRIRLRMVEGFRDAPEPARFHGVLMALVVGYRPHIPQEQWDVFFATGTNHLMAISGLHIGLMAGLGYALVSRLWRRLPGAALRLPAQRAGALAAMLIGTVYALLAGLSVPTQRALVMLCVVMLAVWLGRTGRSWQVLSLALIAVLVWDPAAVLGPGFWLSFGAVAVILMSVSGRLRPPSGWYAAVNIQIVTALGLTPMLLIFFSQTSVVAPLANFLAVPWVGLVVIPIALVAGGLMLIHPALGAPFADLAGWLMTLIWYWLDMLARWPFALWQPASPTWAVAVAAVGIALWLGPRGLPGRLLAPVLCLPLAWPAAPVLPEGGFRLTVLDVGQGLATVVQTRRHTLVYDTGPSFPSGLDTGRAAVVPFLYHEGVRRVDRLILSHGDNDHAGGAAGVLAGIRVSTVQGAWRDTPAAAPIAACERGERWQWDGVDFHILHPPPHWGDDNMSSCVLKVSGPGGSVLLPGDVDSLGEAVLLHYAGPDLRSDVLVLPHHGARKAATDAFLDAVAPRIALVSAGYDSPFGHPHEHVKARLQVRGIPLRNTADEGAIRVDVWPGQPVHSPPGWRMSARHYWHGR